MGLVGSKNGGESQTNRILKQQETIPKHLYLTEEGGSIYAKVRGAECSKLSATDAYYYQPFLKENLKTSDAMEQDGALHAQTQVFRARPGSKNTQSKIYFVMPTKQKPHDQGDFSA